MMKKYTQVVQHLSPGGIETLTLELDKLLSKQCRSNIIVLQGSPAEVFAQWPRLEGYKDKLIFLEKPEGVSFSALLKLAKLLKQQKTDVLHTHHIGPLFYAGLAARLVGIKVRIHTEHDSWHLNNPKANRLQRFLLKSVKPVWVADARQVAEESERKLGRKIDKLILNGIDTDHFIPGDQRAARAQLKLPQTVKLIGCSGRMEHVKGQQFLLDALAQLPLYYHLAFAGGGSCKANLQAQAEDLKLSDRVHFLGQLDDMPLFYQALDLFCLPSLNEGYPLSPLEAQSCGIPALVTKVGGAEETLCPESGCSVKPGNAEAIAHAVKKMSIERPYSSPREHVLKHGSLIEMVRKYSELWEAN